MCFQHVRRLLKSFDGYFFSCEDEVRKMADSIKVEVDWKQKAKNNLTVRTQGLLDVIRNAYRKLNHSKSANHSLTCETGKKCELKAEQRKAEAIELLRRRTLTI